MKQREKKLSDILHDSSTQLGQLLQKVFQLNTLEDSFPDWLEPPLRDHVRLGSYSKGKLTLLAESGSWATQMQFRIPELTEKLRKDPKWAGLIRIEVKVAPHLLDHKTEIVSSEEIPTQKITIPEDARQQLKTIADNLEDGPLKKAVLQLIK